jgi:hypothetical protein
MSKPAATVEQPDQWGGGNPMRYSLRSTGPLEVPPTRPENRDRNDNPTRVVKFEDQVFGPTHLAQPTNSIMRQDGVVRSQVRPAPAHVAVQPTRGVG